MEKRKTTQTITTIDYVLTDKEARLVRYCLDYCYHRISVHGKPVAPLAEVDALRKELAK